MTEHLEAVALICLRVMPIVFLCPLWGGMVAPMVVRLGVCLAFSTSLHVAGDVRVPAQADGAWMALAAVRELLLGLSVGWLSSLPFELVRAAGRWVDTFRGSTAETTLPWVGAQSSAAGELLHHLLVARLASAVGGSWVGSALWRSFRTAPLGVRSLEASGLEEALHALNTVFEAAFVLGAPVAVLALALDLLLGWVSRLAPQVPVGGLAGPAKILAGAACLWAGLDLVIERAMELP